MAFVGRKTKEGNFIKKEIELVGYFPMFGFAKIMKGNKKRITRKITLLCWTTKRKMKENKNNDLQRKKERVVRKKSRNFEEKYFLHDFFNFVSFPLKTGTIYKKKEKVLLSFSFAVKADLRYHGHGGLCIIVLA